VTVKTIISPTLEYKRRRKNKFLIKRLAKHLILSQGWLIKRTVQNEPFVTKFPFILTNLGIWKNVRMTQIFRCLRLCTDYHIYCHIFGTNVSLLSTILYKKTN
jgi:hypothetical protein